MTVAIEFLLWVLLAASAIAVIAARLRIPYTVALVLGGLAIGAVHIPIVDSVIDQRPNWLSPEVILLVFLPPLLFEGSLKVPIRHLRENLIPISILATLGVLVAAFITGYAVHWTIGLPVRTALVFGAIVAATDPISVLAIFKDMAVNKRLSVIVEGESLFNDGTAAVLFTILVGGFESGHLGIGAGIREFFVQSLGGAAVGLAMGYVVSRITRRIDEPSIEITLTTILAFGSYLTAQSLGLSGVIAVVAAGLTTGNFTTRTGMSAHTRISLWSFWEYASFAINSITFLLIGLQVHIRDLVATWHGVLFTIAAVLVGRCLSVYGLIPVSNRLAEKVSLRWQHVLVAGGIRGALALALAMSLSLHFPYRTELLTMTFGVVAFTIVVQGISIKPLLRLLGIVEAKEDELALALVHQAAVSGALAELEDMMASHLVTRPVYERLREGLEERQRQAEKETAEIYSTADGRIEREMREAAKRLLAAEKSAIEQSLHEGVVTRDIARKLIAKADQELDQLILDAEPSQPQPPAQASEGNPSADD